MHWSDVDLEKIQKKCKEIQRWNVGLYQDIVRNLGLTKMRETHDPWCTGRMCAGAPLAHVHERWHSRVYHTGLA
jgi:hypothetical protein